MTRERVFPQPVKPPPFSAVHDMTRNFVTKDQQMSRNEAGVRWTISVTVRMREPSPRFPKKATSTANRLTVN